MVRKLECYSAFTRNQYAGVDIYDSKAAQSRWTDSDGMDQHVTPYLMSYLVLCDRSLISLNDIDVVISRMIAWSISLDDITDDIMVNFT